MPENSFELCTTHRGHILKVLIIMMMKHKLERINLIKRVNMNLGPNS